MFLVPETEIYDLNLECRVRMADAHASEARSRKGMRFSPLPAHHIKSEIKTRSTEVSSTKLPLVAGLTSLSPSLKWETAESFVRSATAS